MDSNRRLISLERPLLLLLLLLHDHADNQAGVERSHDTDPGHEVSVGDERGQLHGEQRLAISLLGRYGFTHINMHGEAGDVDNTKVKGKS